MTASNSARLIKKGGAPAKFNEYSYVSLKHSNINYDYAPSKEVANDQVFDMKKQAQVYRNNKMIGVKRYQPTEQGITIDPPANASVQMPIMLYDKLHYRFTLNGKILTAHYINERLTRQTHELVLKNLPPGIDCIGLRKVNFNNYEF